MSRTPAPWSEMSVNEYPSRRAGILLHPTSLPSGTLDSDVERWLQLMADTGCSIWQVLPLGEPQSGLSPYQCSSAFAFNPLLLPAASSSQSVSIDTNDTLFTAFCDKHGFWLDDYVLFKVLKQHFHESAWTDWPDQWKYRDADVLQQSRQQHQKMITELKWQQYQLHKRWSEISNKASELNILIFGDLPLFIGHDSADVWAHPDCYLLHEDGSMKVVSGVPPDYFSETGQRWGNPQYNWDKMRENDFAWWKSRIQHHLEQFDLIRIDHFRGLEASWMINASCETAIDGYWQKIPGDELLSSLKMSFASSSENGQLPFVAEDLGIITAEVTALRKKYHLPGMSILQFGFDEFDDNPHKLKNIEEDKIVYTGTHDNDTTRGWFNSLDDLVKNQVLQSLELFDENISDWHDVPDVANRVVDTMIDNAMRSCATICIIPLQDCLHLGTEARMNVPGTITDNWLWQFKWQQIDSEKMRHMHSLVGSAGRLVNG